MKGLSIGIIEDEFLIAENIALHIRKMGHTISGTYSRFETVFKDLPHNAPDLFLVDIRLKGKKSGLDVATLLRDQYEIPFLFLTSSSDSGTVRKAMETFPLGYITKPFTYDDLFIAIELVKAKTQLGQKKSRKIEIKNGFEKEWLLLDDILFLEAGRSYATIHQRTGNLVLRQPMGKLLEEFQEGEMVRIHRSYAVNPRRVESVSASKVIVEGQKLPLGPGYRDSFLEWMRALSA